MKEKYFSSNTLKESKGCFPMKCVGSMEKIVTVGWDNLVLRRRKLLRVNSVMLHIFLWPKDSGVLKVFFSWTFHLQCTKADKKKITLTQELVITRKLTESSWYSSLFELLIWLHKFHGHCSKSKFRPKYFSKVFILT